MARQRRHAARVVSCWSHNYGPGPTLDGAAGRGPRPGMDPPALAHHRPDPFLAGGRHPGRGLILRITSKSAVVFLGSGASGSPEVLPA